MHVSRTCSHRGRQNDCNQRRRAPVNSSSLAGMNDGKKQADTRSWEEQFQGGQDKCCNTTPDGRSWEEAQKSETMSLMSGREVGTVETESKIGVHYLAKGGVNYDRNAYCRRLARLHRTYEIQYR